MVAFEYNFHNGNSKGNWNNQFAIHKYCYVVFVSVSIKIVEIIANFRFYSFYFFDDRYLAA